MVSPCTWGSKNKRAVQAVYCIFLLWTDLFPPCWPGGVSPPRAALPLKYASRKLNTRSTAEPAACNFAGNLLKRKSNVGVSVPLSSSLSSSLSSFLPSFLVSALIVPQCEIIYGSQEEHVGPLGSYSSFFSKIPPLNHAASSLLDPFCLFNSVCDIHPTRRTTSDWSINRLLHTGRHCQRRPRVEEHTDNLCLHPFSAFSGPRTAHIVPSLSSPPVLMESESKQICNGY